MTKDEYHKVLNNIAGSFGTLKDQVNQAFEIGRALGLNDMQIGQDVRGKIKGLMSTSTIQRMLPETAKHQEKKRTAAVKMTANPNRRLVVPEEPTIPPLPEVHREAEIVKQEPKPINEPITIPTGDRKIKLDTAKFRSDLRIALINGDKVWLTYNNAKEVIAISDKLSS